MIYFYINKHSDNNDLIVQNGKDYALVKAGITLQTFPSEHFARMYRQILFSFEAITYLQTNFDDLFFSTELFWEYGRNLKDEQVADIAKKGLEKCDILIHYDEFKDKDTSEYEKIEKYFLEAHPAYKDYKEKFLFKYSDIVARSAEKERLKAIIGQIKTWDKDFNAYIPKAIRAIKGESH